MKIIVPTSGTCELHCLTKEEAENVNLADLLMGRIRKCLATLRVLLARVVLLENGEVIKRLIYKFIVCEFRGFKKCIT